MNKSILKILKIISIILILIVEVLVFANYWIGHDLSQYFSPVKAYLILTLLIVVISIIDKVVLALFDLGKAVFSKKYRVKRILEINEHIEKENKNIKVFLQLMHLIIFEHIWLVILVFTLHSTEWLINGWSFINGKVEDVVLYSVGMRVIEYPIVIFTLIFAAVKNKDKYLSMFKKKD